ncbi:hypothetical protein HYQ46_007004 [Verticillium longisporum]|nr:hypothetical protein HYQ46_007004 [Verticillium longisporum]
MSISVVTLSALRGLECAPGGQGRGCSSNGGLSIGGLSRGRLIEVLKGTVFEESEEVGGRAADESEVG